MSSDWGIVVTAISLLSVTMSITILLSMLMSIWIITGIYIYKKHLYEVQLRN